MRQIDGDNIILKRPGKYNDIILFQNGKREKEGKMENLEPPII